jgi:hypothetical protein
LWSRLTAWFLPRVPEITTATVIAVGAAGVPNGPAYTIYQGVDKSGVVRYVGITSRSLANRVSEHLRAWGTGRELLQYNPVGTAQTWQAARIAEQKLINLHGGPKGQLLNIRNEIAQKYWSSLGIK